MHVEHFMTKDPVACDVSQTVDHVAMLMKEKGVGCVVVLQNDRVVGIVSDRQLALHVLAEGLEPAETRVEQIMTREVATVTPEDTLFSVLDTMRSAHVARRIPVVDRNKRLVGLVSISDVAVIAKDLIDAVLLEDVHHATKEAKIMTGGKRIQKDIRSPQEIGQRRDQETTPVTTGSSGVGGGGTSSRGQSGGATGGGRRNP